MPDNRTSPYRSGWALIFCLTVVILSLSAFTSPALGQENEPGPVQVLNGSIVGSNDTAVYVIPSLQAGQTLSVTGQATSGNLDPLIVFLPMADFESGKLRQRLDEAVAAAIARNEDPLALLDDFANANFLAWDDDSGAGFGAAFTYEIPADGDYLLGLLSSPFNDTFGDYRLVVGLNAPDVITGRAVTRGDPFVEPLAMSAQHQTGVSELVAVLTTETPQRVHRLEPFEQGERIDVFVETLSGDLIPQITLSAYATKPVRTANLGGTAPQTTLSYIFPDAETDYQLEVNAVEGTSGEYRLLVGRDDSDVLTGTAVVHGQPVIETPLQVGVGIKLQQIANLDQKSEHYDAVASLFMRWSDPDLAFRPDECRCEFQVYTIEEFYDYATTNGISLPLYTYLNQQNNRWVQNDYVVVSPNGDAILFERFTTTFQAPDFDFHQFPFDQQQFFIRVDSIYGTRFVEFFPSADTEIGEQLGEEEWYIVDSETEIVTEASSTSNETDGFIFRFFARRRLAFYIFRIFLPLALILAVTWISFFMDDYGKRVEATTANLLLFIAFNFTIANELPRLGYLTFLDTILVGAFFISVLIVIYNVYLRRQENKGRESRVGVIDKYMIWLYPLGYLLAFSGVTWFYFGR